MDSWDLIIFHYTGECPNTLAQKEYLGIPNFTLQEAARENWEWACFVHYRETFRTWAMSGTPCERCANRLSQMPAYVEYDEFLEAEHYFQQQNYTEDPAWGDSHLKCLPSYCETDEANVACLEPLLTILFQSHNKNWLDLLAPLIELHTGWTANELYRVYRRRCAQRRSDESSTSPGRQITGLTFEVRDLDYVAYVVHCEVERKEAIQRMMESSPPIAIADKEDDTDPILESDSSESPDIVNLSPASPLISIRQSRVRSQSPPFFQQEINDSLSSPPTNMAPLNVAWPDQSLISHQSQARNRQTSISPSDRSGSSRYSPLSPFHHP